MITLVAQLQFGPSTQLIGFLRRPPISGHLLALLAGEKFQRAAYALDLKSRGCPCSVIQGTHFSLNRGAGEQLAALSIDRLKSRLQ